MPKPQIFKRVISVPGLPKAMGVLLLIGGASTLGGCDIAATPAYSGQERFQQIGRNWNYEYEQLADDTDNALLLRPASTLTIWNVYHRD